jgi:hypothetical protein
MNAGWDRWKRCRRTAAGVRWYRASYQTNTEYTVVRRLRICRRHDVRQRTEEAPLGLCRTVSSIAADVALPLSLRTRPGVALQKKKARFAL